MNDQPPASGGASEAPPELVAAASSAAPELPAPAPVAARPRWYKRIVPWVVSYFRDEPLTFVTALVPMCFLSILLYTRLFQIQHGHIVPTNFIFDEQEALLANPYVRSVTEHGSHLHWIDAFRRDFWGLPHDRTIGSYRPLPDLVWRFLWMCGARDQSPFLDHWINVLLHGVNGALVAVIALRITKDRTTAWLAGALFTAAAVVTEAVSGVVGLADVLGTLGALLALCSLALPLWGMPFAVLASTLFGLYSKESALCVVPMVPYAALFVADVTHPKRPMRWVRALVCALATAAAFVFYVEQRRRSFPATIPPDLTVQANLGKPWAVRFYHGLLRWYAQPILPKDPLNNPLVDAKTPLRIAGALRVYARGLGEVLLPYHLSGDYSAPQEPIPARVIFPESVIGAVTLVLPVILSPILGFLGVVKKRPRLALAGVSLLWIFVSYFPVSNIPILLPTVRAERFWYFPVIGTSMLLAMFFAWLVRREGFVTIKSVTIPARRFGVAAFCVFLGWQCVAARAHADDYTNDLVFWDATRHAVPNSAKAHLNYSVMKGARGDMEARRRANLRALQLAPDWPMANIYMGDTLCRMHRAAEAWPYYKRGFELAPGDPNLIALALQCIWDEKYYPKVEDELAEMGAKNPGSWLDYLQRDMADHGEQNNGVDPKYRPRSYNEGPKDDK